MLRYFPLDIGLEVNAASADLRSFNWFEQMAEFTVDNEASLLRVRFRTDVIVRILDEFPLSVETEPSDRHGLVPYHFAYRVQGAAFAKQQSEAWLSSQFHAYGRVQHFQFVTGGGCLDALTASEPEFMLIPNHQDGVPRP